MPLTEAQIATLSELVSAAYAETSSAWAAVQVGKTAAEVSALEGRLSGIAAEYDAKKSKHLRLAGGRDGVDIDYDRDRGALRRRARKLLVMSAASEMPIGFALASGCRGR